MRHGENPLQVTGRIKEKIQELQAGLPAGVHIVPAYDRTRLITGAIHTLAEVMTHEMIIASLAILLILMHVRSVFVICITLPLAVLFSFLLMWVLRQTGIIDIQANIMSVGRHHDLARHFGRSGDRDDRKRYASSQAAFWRQTRHRRYAGTGDRAVPHSWAADLLLGDDHAAVVRAGLHAQRPRGQAVSSAGLHEELRHARRGADFDHRGAGADSYLHPWPIAQRRRESDRAQLHPHLQADAHLGVAAAKPGDVGFRRATDHVGRHVSRAGTAWNGRQRKRLEDGLPAGVLHRQRGHPTLDGRPASARHCLIRPRRSLVPGGDRTNRGGGPRLLGRQPVSGTWSYRLLG